MQSPVYSEFDKEVVDAAIINKCFPTSAIPAPKRGEISSSHTAECHWGSVPADKLRILHIEYYANLNYVWQSIWFFISIFTA
jgi:hypothetical protein